MTNYLSPTSRNLLLEYEISSHVEALIGATTLKAPNSASPLVKCFVSKVEGNFSFETIERDVEHAVDLLFIAYNATPLRYSQQRIAISHVMDNFVDVQQAAEFAIQDSIREAAAIRKKLDAAMKKWLPIRRSNDADQIKQCVLTELRPLASYIIEVATAVEAGLSGIVRQYDAIIKAAENCTARSEKDLGNAIKLERSVLDDINKAKADRDRLDSSVADLRKEIDRFRALAQSYRKQADSQEKRAFWQKLVNVVVHVFVPIVPLVAGKAIGAGGVGTQAALDEVQIGAEDVVKKNDLQAQIKAQQAVVKSTQGDVAQLEAAVAAGKTELEKNQQTKRLAAERTKLASEQTKLVKLESQLAELLRKIDKATSSDKPKEQSLRQAQYAMMNKVRAYRRIESEQVLELRKVKNLLTKKQDEKRDVELVLRCLNISVSALKRCKEVLLSVAALFQSFAEFMQLIVDEAQLRLEEFDQVEAKSQLRKQYLEHLKESNDRFFITQTAEWLAVGLVADKCERVLNGSWTKLCELTGDHITRLRIDQFLADASIKLEAIAEEREAFTHQQLVSMDHYENELKKQA
ncbi:hypothetical protein [Pseudomonas sp. PSKL.D1]|uniref:hypothetical protein n=1 Tax=Pseudomonas sp. PSKL.D1 TaxID=3029060 RepID=UPI0023815353|nr:hypothetical protein [Pseudomonas sp. PSKL.D1]WDY55607.1 hypothetical protein PVV54_13380 [Pseudomonas sp. PSKL.D1]